MSESANPIPEDVAVTKTLVQTGELLGLELLDHIIVGNGRFVSLRALESSFQMALL